MILHIHIPVCNNPEFIRLQVQTLEKFCQDRFEITIFNDAKLFPDFSNFGDTSIHQKIIDVCAELRIRCINIDNSEDETLISASLRHSRTANIMWHQYEKHLEEPLLVLDSDMFPIRNFSILDELRDYDFSYTSQVRQDFEYAWPNLFWCNPPKLQKKDLLDWGIEPFKSDTGGKSSLFLQLQDLMKLHRHQHFVSFQWNKHDIKDRSQFPISVINFCDKDIKNKDGKYWCEIYHDTFLHLRAGSNWENIDISIHKERTESIKTVLTALCQPTHLNSID